MNPLTLHIEALVFAAEQPVGIKDIKECLEEIFETTVKIEEIQQSLQDLQTKYNADSFAFELREISGGWQFLTKSSYFRIISTLLKNRTKKRLSQAALETLSIIAYKQPIAKSELEKIRGVSCDYSIQKLMEKELIAPAGRSEAPGRPLLYVTGERFMDYLGLKSITDLPKLKDFSLVENEIGISPDTQETIVSED